MWKKDIDGLPLSLISLKERVALVARVNGGIGLETACQLHWSGATVSLRYQSQSCVTDATRDINTLFSQPSAEGLLSLTRLKFVDLNLASIDLVYRAVQCLLEMGLPLNILINN